jgi:hypothetical protein
MNDVAHRRSDPHCCNKCFAPLPPDGICRQPHSNSSLPPMVEQGAVTCGGPRAGPLVLGHPDHDARWLGKSHVGKLARAVGT